VGAIRSHRTGYQRVWFKPRPSIETAPQSMLPCTGPRPHKLTLSGEKLWLRTQGGEAALAGACCPATGGPSHASRGRTDALSWQNQLLLADLNAPWSKSCGLPSRLLRDAKQVRVLPLDRMIAQDPACASTGRELPGPLGRYSSSCPLQSSRVWDTRRSIKVGVSLPLRVRIRLTEGSRLGCCDDGMPVRAVVARFTQLRDSLILLHGIVTRGLCTATPVSVHVQCHSLSANVQLAPSQGDRGRISHCVCG
jgi:hypothetical protein